MIGGELSGSTRGPATLAFALLRFEMAAAHVRGKPTGSQAPAGYEENYTFLPSWRRIHFSKVVEFLANLPSPAILAPTTWRGAVALLLLDELAPERQKSALHSFANHRNALTECAESLHLSPTSRILLEFGDEEYLFHFETLYRCLERFVVITGWNLSRLRHDFLGAVARLNLFRSDGGNSWGHSCPLDLPVG